MIEYSTYCRIHDLAAQGFRAAAIADQLGLDEKTVRKWLERKKYQQRTGTSRSSKLDPFKARIAGWLAQANFTLPQIHQKLLSEGYEGGRTVVGDYLRLIRPRTRRAYQTLHFEPGEAAQIDWGNWQSVQIGSTRRRVSFLCVVLCHSRMLYVEAFLQERIEHVLGGLANAFAYFGGVPRKVIVDNMKTAVIEHRPGCEPKFNARFLDFCHHHGSEPRACTPRRPNQKGRVEAAVGYVKGNFFNGLDPGVLPAPEPLESLNASLRLWMEHTANVRQHRELQARPLDRMAAERSALLPLNANPCDTGATLTVRVTNRCRIHCDGNRYSVPPPYSQKHVVLHRYHDRLCLYYQGKLIARHPRSYERNRQVVDPEHQSALLSQDGRAKAASDQLAFEALSPLAPLWLANLRIHHAGSALHHLRRVLLLSQIHGPEAVVRALEQSHEYGVYTATTIAHFIECQQRAARQPPLSPMAPTSASRELLGIRLNRPNLDHYPGNPIANPQS